VTSSMDASGIMKTGSGIAGSGLVVYMKAFQCGQ
jgi:hypothetical protein